MIVSLIVAVSENNVIGKDNDLIWRLPKDMKFFKEKTLGHFVLMGRKNFESIPEKFRPLPDRVNIVVTRGDMKSDGNLHVVDDIQKGIDFAFNGGEDELFIIGGGEIYRQSLEIADKIYLTRVHSEFEGDTFFPEIDEEKWLLLSQVHHKADDKHAHDFTFMEYLKK